MLINLLIVLISNLDIWILLCYSNKSLNFKYNSFNKYIPCKDSFHNTPIDVNINPIHHFINLKITGFNKSYT